MGKMERLQMLPDWPRMMAKETACAYLDLSLVDFEREIAAGRLPQPVQFGKAPHWSRADIDEHVDRLTGSVNDWRAGTKLYGQA